MKMFKIEKFLFFFDLIKGAFVIFIFNFVTFSALIAIQALEIYTFSREGEPTEDFKLRVKRFSAKTGHGEFHGEQSPQASQKP